MILLKLVLRQAQHDLIPFYLAIKLYYHEVNLNIFYILATYIYFIYTSQLINVMSVRACRGPNPAF